MKASPEGSSSALSSITGWVSSSGFGSPVIPAPMQKPRKAVAEIEPLEKPYFDQGQVHQAVEVPLLRIKTGVEPDGVAIAYALLEQRHLVVEPPQLRNPDVAILLQHLRQIFRVDGIESRNSRHLLVNEGSEPAVIGRLIPVRLVKDVLKITGVPAFFLEMCSQGG